MKKKKIMFSILMIILFTIYVYVVSIQAIPDNIIIFEGEKINLKTMLGLKTNLIESDKIIETSVVNQEKVMNSPGKKVLKLSLFENIFLKDIDVDVLPKTKVIPVGNIAGIKLYTNGVLVVGMSEIQGIDNKKYKPYENTGIQEGDRIIEINNNNIENTEGENIEDKKENTDKKDLLSYPETPEEYFGYEDVEGGVRITYYMSEGQTDGVVVIPAQINGKNVVEIGPEAFSSADLRGIITGQNVTIINEKAFQNAKIEEIIINGKLEKIQQEAFILANIDYIEFPDSLKEIGVAAFQCASVKEIVIPDSVENIEAAAFCMCKNLEKVKIGKNSTIGNMAFYDCPNLTEVEIPAEVSDIKESIFYESENVVVITPEGSYAEQYCKENNIAVKNK